MTQPDAQQGCPLQRGSDGGEPRAPGPVLDWVVWPARRHWLVGLVVLAFILALAAAVWWAAESLLQPLLTVVLLLVAVSPYYFPTRYTVTAEGVEVHSLLGPHRKAWGSLQVYFADGERGVLLSPVAEWGLLARTRGVYLPFAGNADEVMQMVKRRLKEGHGPTHGRGKQ